MASRKEIFRQVREKFPKQPLTGPGITLDYLQNLLEIVGSRKETVLFKLSNSIRDLVLSYVNDRLYPPLVRNWKHIEVPKITPLRDIYALKLRRFLGTTSLPPLPSLPAEQIYGDLTEKRKVFKYYNVSLRKILRSLGEHTKEIEPYLKWVIDHHPQITWPDVSELEDKAYTAVRLGNFEAYSFYIKYIPHQEIIKGTHQSTKLFDEGLHGVSDRFGSYVNYLADSRKKKGDGLSLKVNEIKESLKILEDLFERGIYQQKIKDVWPQSDWKALLNFLKKNKRFESRRTREYLERELGSGKKE